MVTGVKHSGPRRDFPETLLAHSSIAEEGRCGAEQTIVMERLYYRDPSFSTDVICGWGDQGKSVVNVRDIRLDIVQEAL